MKRWKWCISLLICTLVASLFIASCKNQSAESGAIAATREVEDQLTNAYGKRVSEVIENFERNWFSFDAHINPEIQSELATSQYRDYFGYSIADDTVMSEPYWLVVRSADIEDLRVIEYELERFKALACLQLLDDKVTVEGELINVLPLRRTCRVYVFFRENDEWKLAALFDTTIPKDAWRDWDSAPVWLKEIIGELPDDPSMIRERSQ